MPASFKISKKWIEVSRFALPIPSIVKPTAFSPGSKTPSFPVPVSYTHLHTKISMISVGPERNSNIIVHEMLK